jgi:hypothetical protein
LVDWLVNLLSSGLESPDSINLHKRIVKHIEGKTRWGRGVKTRGTFVVNVIEAVVGRAGKINLLLSMLTARI